MKQEIIADLSRITEEEQAILDGKTEVEKWWDYMADIMAVNPDNSPVSIPLEEVFYME